MHDPSETVTISPKFQVVIPKLIREQLKLQVVTAMQQGGSSI
jgi:bifunctional DNA-binding transcriptional regulator/antitoxin component of YhaV-PrlF toxin-antitoxin module